MQAHLTVNGRKIPLTHAHTIIVGAGAAAMNCAVKLAEAALQRGLSEPDVLVVTGGLPLGASRMSGSDKQTYYKMGTSPTVSDTAAEFAKALTAFGCCHGDHALIEGIGSLRGFYHLVEAGVPFPHDESGTFVGYKTDHDPFERATSAGPKTSRFMSECLQAKALRLGVRMIDKHPVLKLITAGSGRGKRLSAMLCLDRARTTPRRAALAAFTADNWVLAAGGPGEIYRDTVYPRGQTGLHGAALEAGLEACNLTESQYGLASIDFRWNVSGTYMQVVPRMFSTDARGGDAREFLCEYFGSMEQMASNIFLKGYQWPFDAQRIAGAQSSLIDMAVHQETIVRGRRVWMDFTRNPVGRASWRRFDISRLIPEARDYLRKAGALQSTPIKRLAHMNAPAIDIYAENGIDIRRRPLQIALCAQHNNGGFAVSAWWESNIPRTFVIGEMAGTHGVKRPGGAALNSGQVGAARAAEYIANVYTSGTQTPASAGKAIAQAAREALDMLSPAASQTPKAVMAEVRERMTRHGAHIRSLAGAAEAFEAAQAQYRRLARTGLKAPEGELDQAAAAMQQCLTHVAMLGAIKAVLEQGGGSRGSHCVLSEDGVEMHPSLVDPRTGRSYRVKPENVNLRKRILHVRADMGSKALLRFRNVAPREAPASREAFEVAWARYRRGEIYGRGE
jgi:succinate dehydrogenase/fumarate reductase flavoprotein subunit